MEDSLKNINLSVSMCKKLPDIAVILGFPFNVNQLCLNELKYNGPSENKLITGVESACLGFALYELVREKMVGSPLEVSRSRVSHLSCNSLGGKFLLTWNTQGSLSMLRKTIGLTLSCLSPHKLHSRYAENCKMMGISNNRTVFNKLANEMSDGIKKSIKIAAIGKIKLDPSKLKLVLSKVSTKLPKQDHIKDTSNAPKYEDVKLEYPLVKSSGIASVAIADYILSKSGGMAVSVIDNGVVVYNKSWETKHKSLKKANRISDYVRQKYEKLGPEFSCIFGYLAITRELADCCTVNKIIKTKPTPKNVSDLIKKGL